MSSRQAITPNEIGQNAQSIRAAAVLTGAYVGSTSLDLSGFNTVAIQCVVVGSGTDAGSLKFQWSCDNTTWYDEQILVNGAAASGEQPQAAYSRRVDIDMSTSGNIYTERFNRLNGFFRVVAKSKSGNTATLAITAVRFIA